MKPFLYCSFQLLQENKKKILFNCGNILKTLSNISSDDNPTTTNERSLIIRFSTETPPNSPNKLNYKFKKTVAILSCNLSCTLKASLKNEIILNIPDPISSQC